MAKKKPQNDTKAGDKPTDKTPPPARMKIERFEAELKCELSTAEVAEQAERAAQLLARYDLEREELKEEIKRKKGALNAMTQEMRRASKEVRERVTYRMVQCERKYLFEEGKVVDTRLDNGAVINTRPMTEAETQQELPFNEPPKEGDNLDDDFGGDEDAAE